MRQVSTAVSLAVSRNFFQKGKIWKATILTLGIFLMNHALSQLRYIIVSYLLSHEFQSNQTHLSHLVIDFSPASEMSKQYERNYQSRNKRRTDSYRQYSNDYQYNPQDSYYFDEDQQWEMNSLDEYQFDSADQADECTSFDELYHTNEEYSSYTTTQRQMSTYTDTHRTRSFLTLDRQQSYSDVSTNCKLVSSTSRFTIENLNRQIATVRISVLKHLCEELKVLFHVRMGSFPLIIKYNCSYCCFIGKST